jgi:hypothetical protein
MFPSSRPRYLLVVQSTRPEVYAHLETVATPGVDLFWDRRHGERRTVPAVVAAERRHHERRSPPPPTCTVLGFVLHRVEAPSL